MNSTRSSGNIQHSTILHTILPSAALLHTILPSAALLHAKLLRALLLLLLLSPAAASAQALTTAIFSPTIRSLTVNIEGNRLAPPVLTLDSSDRLIIGFDDMAEDRQYLRYSITHCNADWAPSDLVDSEVFDGFNYADIDNVAFSRATTAHYVHYTITLPNSDFQFRISGNYLLRVYPEDDPDQILLQVPFMVQEASATISGTVSANTDIDYRNAHQQLTLDIDTRTSRIRDANTDLRVVVTQNSRPDTRVVLTHPSRLMGTRAIYEHNPRLIFPAGNEYRRMEIVNNLYPGMGVDHIEYHPPYYYHILNTDHPRAHREYRYDSTQHGRYFIREYSSENSDIEADYVLTLFTLDLQEIPDCDVYLDGDFRLRALDASSRMDYNHAEGRYERLLPLKQGAYNYQYLTLPKASSSHSPSPFPSHSQASSQISSPQTYPLPSRTAHIEGDHYQTVNEYQIAVYYREPGARYDRLLTFTLLY